MLKVLFITESADSVCRDSIDMHFFYMVIAAKKSLKGHRLITQVFFLLVQNCMTPSQWCNLKCHEVLQTSPEELWLHL